jgi:hypothetical protein
VSGGVFLSLREIHSLEVSTANLLHKRQRQTAVFLMELLIGLELHHAIAHKDSLNCELVSHSGGGGENFLDQSGERAQTKLLLEPGNCPPLLKIG